jgi:hypothetical protein
MKLESEIQSRLIKKYSKEGWLCCKIIQTSLNGIPDILLIKNGQYKWIEVKRKGKKLDPLQEYRKKELESFGAIVETFISEE